MKQFIIHKHSVLGLGLILIILCHYTCNELIKLADFVYLFNRAEQILSCLSDGNLPFFYYNDFGGVGYGSSFFYGQLTLFPFLPLVKFGMSTFCSIYVLATLLVNFFGAQYFASRFSYNFRFIALMYIGSSCCLNLFILKATYPFYLGMGISFFFLAKCVDFFRGRRFSVVLPLLFFITLNTNLLASAVAFIGCCVLCITYFKIRDLLNYIFFALVTLVLCSYNICNYVYHADILRSASALSDINLKHCFSNPLPFGGMVFGLFITHQNSNVNFTSLTVLYLGIINFIKTCRGRDKRLTLLASALFLFIALCGVEPIWLFIKDYLVIPFQFPLRFYQCGVLLLLMVLFKRVSSKKLITLCIISCFIDALLFFPAVPQTKPASEYKANNTSQEKLLSYTYYTKHSDEHWAFCMCQIVNGEYLDNSFVWNVDNLLDMGSHVYDKNHKSYEYTLNKEKLEVCLPENRDSTLSLTFPKLYYRGYKLKCTDTGKYYQIKRGYSQFITADIPKDAGSHFALEYVHPEGLRCLYFFVIFIIAGLLAILCFQQYKRKHIL